MRVVAMLLALAASAAAQKTYTYETVDGVSIQADVYRPKDDVVRPVILWIHGGALIMGHRGNLRPAQRDRYLEAGYAVVSIDYRLAPETKLPAILEDLQDAYRWLRAEGPKLFRIDPDRVAVVGHSAGGYLTLAAGYLFRPRLRALVSFYGYGDIAGAWYSRPDPFYLKSPAVSKEEAYASVGSAIITGAAGPNQRGRFYLYCRQQGLWPKEVAGRDPFTEPAAFDAWCPSRNVTGDYPPTLLLHGDADTDVPFEQSEQMARELERRRVLYEFVRIPGGPHGFDGNLQNPRAVEAFDTVLAFLSERLHPAR